MPTPEKPDAGQFIVDAYWRPGPGEPLDAPLFRMLVWSAALCAEAGVRLLAELGRVLRETNAGQFVESRDQSEGRIRLAKMRLEESAKGS